jgi:acetyltransferase-like isoleucine patch superfamily enzyme
MMEPELETWLQRFREAYNALREHGRQQWNRDLPFWELVFDRWEHAKELGFGEGASVYHSCHVLGDVSVGPRTWVGPNTVLDGSGGLKIGRNCSISAGAQIYSHHTVAWALSDGVEPYVRAATEIQDCCYIGPHAVVSMGVVVGHHSVIGAHTLVNRSVEPYSVVYGVPGRTVGRVVMESGTPPRLEYFARVDPASSSRRD